jgi:hypothetical protein
MKIFLDNELGDRHKMICVSEQIKDDNLLMVFKLFFRILTAYGYTRLQIQYCILSMCEELNLISFDKTDDSDSDEEITDEDIEDLFK